MSQTFASSTLLLFNFSSIILMLLLLGIILKSPSYLTKWTLFQVCLALLGSSISSILKLLTYGDDYDNLDRALNQPICIAQQKLSIFFFYPLYLLPSVLTFHLWFGLIKMNSNIEKAHFWTLTISVWGFSCLYTTIVIIVSGLNENWGVMVTRFVCEAYDFSSTWYLYWPVQLIVSLLAFVSLFFAIRSTIILWKIWSAYNLNNQSSEEIQIGHAVRMIIFIYLYFLMLFFHMISVILQQSKSHHTKSYIDHSHYISNFTSSLFGGLAFLIFGTTKSSLLSITQYLGYKNKSDDDDTLYVFRPSSYHLESIAKTDIKTKRTTRDTIESEAVTIEVLVENDRHPSFLEKQKRTKHYSLQKYTKDRRLSGGGGGGGYNSDWSRYSNSSAGSSREHSSSRNSNRRRRHSDTRHNGSQRRRRHHHQDTNESKNRKNNDISFGNSRRIMIGNSDEVVSRSNSDTTSDRRRRRKGRRRGRNSDVSNSHSRHSDSYASRRGRSSSMISNNGRSSSLLHIDGIDERLEQTNNNNNNNNNNSSSSNHRSSKNNNIRNSKNNNIRNSKNSTNSVSSYSKQDLQRIWGQV